MSTESNMVGNMHTNDSTDEDASDDDFLFTDDIVANFGDVIMFNCFVASKSSVIGRKQLLKDGKKVSVEEGVAMFLMIVGHTTRYSIIGDRFQHSNNTIHKWFKRVLRAVCSLGTEIICPTHQNVPHERILRKFPYFKDCIGAIDGTHVAAWAPTSRQTSFRGRKTNITQNVMLTCDFDMKFTFVYSGWEGTANDSRVFIDAVTRTSNNFPMPRGDQFYLVDSGYPNMPGFLAPYRGRRYHLHDYLGRGRPRGKEELFNYRHSSCQNMVFQDMPESSQDQGAIQFDASQTTQMGQVRDQIVTQMWNDFSRSRT
ncbi:protein ALP1-like [Diospyros lotus]|uniref:protein ALP1-like n=1 Tax=Diospyros lotus TaxID=55363 RepID=UPI00225AEFD8|nr:protein ALP1-like [Diospyros lotus]